MPLDRDGSTSAINGSVWTLAAQVDEIRTDPVLRVYGAGLAFINVLTVLFWRQMGELAAMSQGAEPICWPLLPGCAGWRRFSLGEVESLLQAFGARVDPRGRTLPLFDGSSPRRMRV